ncbi:DUF1007 family protein [Halomonas heilongjiangensis]|uniref:DUF1007 domain-containing protein n=1 Tax=Halomonas heilongjiangensis TaxID=1387883 RepID=A0A2N7TFV5_9GAMM|nr:DUF1007 family protein [Halomonas heilongjiangensis]PMR67049.1 DUF1007 domain-containing protein [Halomonas heilongjiangensis]PXX88158.1 hypothetical protein CR158_15005 [Halomonas heilongjiangensis]
MTSATLRHRLAGVFLLALGLSLAAPVQAHPHGWIDLRMRLVFDDDGRLEALHQSWRMDPFYSLVVLEELGQAAGEGGLEAGLDQLGVEIRDNLAPQGYFTELRLDDEKVALGEVDEYTVMERDGRVEFVFLLPLAEPLALGGETLRYQVFDPSYYIEVVHEEEEDGEPLDDALVVSGRECVTGVIPPDPDPERVMEAAMLDVTDEAEPGLGRHFAETGEVTCG